MVFILIPTLTSAQTGSVAGVITDAATGKPLGDARVVLENRGDISSDEHGMYRFMKVPGGDHTLTVSMPGYVPQQIQVSVGTGNHSMDMIQLESRFPDGDRILLEGRMREQSRSLARQSESVNFKTVLSAQQMEAFGDRTLEDAMARVPGVHTGRHGGVNIRGVGYERYNVTLDGRRMATTGFGDRSVDLSGISADMAHQLEVIRVLTPDMHADGLGGTVNIRTRRPAGERSLGAYGGVGAHPAYFRYGGTGARTGLHYSEAIREDLSFGVNLNYQQDYYGMETLELVHDAADFGAGPTDVIRRVSPGLQTNQQGRLSGGLQLNYSPTEQTMYHINGFYNNDHRTLDLHRNYWDTGGDWIRPDTTGAEGQLGGYGYDARRQDHDVQQYVIQAGARHWFDHFDLQYDLNWSTAQVRQEQFVFPFLRDGLDFDIHLQNPDRPSMTPTNIVLKRDGTIDYRVIRLQGVERTVNDHTDNSFSGNVDVNIPLGVVSFKIGSGALLNYKVGEFRDTDFSYSRSLDLYRFSLIPLGAINIFDEDAYYIPWIMDTNGGRILYEDHTPSFSRDENQERRDSDIWNYDHSEHIYSGYGMGTVQLGNLQLLGGVRVEHTLAAYEGRSAEFDEEGEWISTHAVTSDRQYTHLFPNVHLAFKPSDNSNIRLAWSQSIARPAFNRLSPFSLTHRQDSTLFRGNPELDPMTSDNLDLLVDHYFQGVGQVGIGVFYKQLSDFVFERSRRLTGGEFAGYSERYYENGSEQATLYGVELSWQQNLTFLPGFLGNLGTYVNYTWSQSEFDVDFRPDEEIPLPGHSPHILNAALNYTRGRVFTQVSYHWTAESLITLAETPVWAPSVSTTEQVYLDRYDGGLSDLSVSVGFRISEHFRFWADVSNLLRSERLIYDHSRSAYLVETDMSQGIVFRSGFRYNL